MADETAQDATTATEQVSVTETTTEQTETGERTYDAGYVKALRTEAAANRAKAREAEARLKALEDAQLSEGEKKDRRLKELEDEVGTLRQQTRRAEVQAAAAKAGAVDADVVARLVEDDEADVQRAVHALKRDKPYLFNRPGAGSADGGAGGRAIDSPNMNDYIRRAAGRR
jgi:hypothetical protein